MSVNTRATLDEILSQIDKIEDEAAKWGKSSKWDIDDLNSMMDIVYDSSVNISNHLMPNIYCSFCGNRTPTVFTFDGHCYVCTSVLRERAEQDALEFETEAIEALDKIKSMSDELTVIQTALKFIAENGDTSSVRVAEHALLKLKDITE